MLGFRKFGNQLSILLAVALIGGSLSSCASRGRFVPGDQAPDGVKKPFPMATSAKDCAGLRGVWRAVNQPALFPNGGYCQFKTKDTGKACRNSRDCEGYCELTFDGPQDKPKKPQCSSFAPPRWDRCVPGYFEDGKVLGRGECFGDDSEVQ